MTVVEKFIQLGVQVKKVDSQKELKSNSWVLPSTDRKGMIKLETKRK